MSVFSWNTHTHNCFTALWILSGTNWVSRHQKGKTNLNLLEQEIVSGSGISCAICKSTMIQIHNHARILPLSFFTDRMPFLPPNQQCQSTEGLEITTIIGVLLSERKHSWCGTFPWTICPSVCQSAKCIAAKQLIGSRCHLGWWVGLFEGWVY